MPLRPGDIRDVQLHRVRINCHKWHVLDEGREFELKRMLPAAGEFGRAPAGITDPVRFVCHACDRNHWRMRVAFVAIILALGVVAVVVQLALGGWAP